jgi:4-hydroxybenzoate polyprenyltransferase
MTFTDVRTIPKSAGRGVLARPWIRLLRPVQWSKNVILFAGAVFGSVIDQPQQFLEAFTAFVAFCLISSATYIFNDWIDADADRLHPTKCFRPIASGAISAQRALTAAGILALVGLALSAALGWWFLLVAGAYLVLMTAYCLELKDVVILDVFIIAGGFVLRAVGGAVAVSLPISPWLLFCTMLLALFLGFCKRRSELVVLSDHSRTYRRSLAAYTVTMLDQAISVTAGATIMAYSIYTFNSTQAPSNNIMMITIPFVAFAMFRYLYLVYARNLGGSPESLLFRDPPLLASILLWGLAAVIVSLFR